MDHAVVFAQVACEVAGVLAEVSQLPVAALLEGLAFAVVLLVVVYEVLVVKIAAAIAVAAAASRYPPLSAEDSFSYGYEYVFSLVADRLAVAARRR